MSCLCFLAVLALSLLPNHLHCLTSLLGMCFPPSLSQDNNMYHFIHILIIWLSSLTGVDRYIISFDATHGDTASLSLWLLILWHLLLLQLLLFQLLCCLGNRWSGHPVIVFKHRFVSSAAGLIYGEHCTAEGSAVQCAVSQPWGS